MMQESVETLDMDIPDDSDLEDEFADLKDMVRTTSLSNCPIEEVEVCNATRSLKGSCENLANLAINSETIFRPNCKSRCKKDVVCKLFKIIESPSSERKNSSRNGNSIMIEESKSPVPTISGDVDSSEDSKLDSPTSAKAEAEHRTTVWESIKGIVSLYKNPVYVLISICMSTYVIIFIPLLTVIVDYSRDKGIHESAGKYLINAMAFGDLIGRLCFGWVTDKGIISIPVFMMMSLVLEGIVISLFPFAISMYSLSLLLIFYGITAGTILVHFPVLVLKYVDIKLQAVAMGCVGFFSGIVSFGIPPLIGHFRDTVGSYDGLFYVTGIISVVSGGLWLLEPILARKQRKKAKRKAIARLARATEFANGTTIVKADDRTCGK